MSVDEAVDRADVLVIAVWLDAFKQLIAQYGERCQQGDRRPTNPVGPDDAATTARSSASRVFGPDPGRTAAAGARLVKAFGTLSAGSLSAAARQEPERAVQFYAADDEAAGDLVADLIRAGGYEPVRVGGLDQSIRIEMFGDLHEYGALGRVVTKTEALKAI